MPRYKHFETAEAFEKAFLEYLKYCERKKRLPNVAGFVVKERMSRQGFYIQKDFYPETFELINAMLEDEALNNKTVSDALKIFYMKNKCGYKDKIEEEVKNTQRIEIVNDLGAIDED